jgi:tetratricopeptide (TPR) repeat protein
MAFDRLQDGPPFVNIRYPVPAPDWPGATPEPAPRPRSGADGRALDPIGLGDRPGYAARPMTNGRFIAVLWVTLTGIALVILPLRAEAQNASGIARVRFEEGTAHYDARRYEEARVAFLQARALDAQPEYLLHLGHAELRIGQAADAANHLAQYLRENPGAPEADRQEADLDLAAARARATEVTVQAPDGSEVFVEAQSVGKAPFQAPFFVTPGVRTFRIARGGTTSERQLEAAPGSSLRVDFGSPGVTSPPEEAVASEPPPLDETTEHPRSKRKPFLEWFGQSPIAWVGAGLTGAGLVLGTAFAITSKTHFDRANDLRAQLIASSPSEAPCTNPANASIAAACNEFDDSRSTGESQRTVAIVGFVLSGVAAAGTVVAYFVDPKAERSDGAGVRFAPVAHGGGPGLTVLGRF